MNVRRVVQATFVALLCATSALSFWSAHELRAMRTAPSTKTYGAAVPIPPPTGTATTVLTYPGAYPVTWAAGGGGSVPTGTGFPHITSGAQDPASRAVNVGTSDIAGIEGFANGGTGLSTGTTAGNLLTWTGSAWAADPPDAIILYPIDGTSDDWPTVIAAVNTAAANGQTVILKPDPAHLTRHFQVLSVPSLTASHARLMGTPTTQIDANYSGASAMFSFNATNSGSPTTLVTSMVYGATTFASPVSLPTGTLLEIGTTLPHAQVYTSKGQTGTGPYTVTLDRPIAFANFTTGNGAFVQVLTSAPTDTLIDGRGMTINITAAGAVYQAYACTRCNIQNVTVLSSTGSWNGGSGAPFVYDSGCFDSHASHIVELDVGGTAGATNAFDIAGGERVSVDDCYARANSTVSTIYLMQLSSRSSFSRDVSYGGGAQGFYDIASLDSLFDQDVALNNGTDGISAGTSSTRLRVNGATLRGNQNGIEFDGLYTSFTNSSSGYSSAWNAVVDIGAVGTTIDRVDFSNGALGGLLASGPFAASNITASGNGNQDIEVYGTTGTPNMSVDGFIFSDSTCNAISVAASANLRIAAGTINEVGTSGAYGIFQTAGTITAHDVHYAGSNIANTIGLATTGTFVGDSASTFANVGTPFDLGGGAQVIRETYTTGAVNGWALYTGANTPTAQLGAGSSDFVDLGGSTIAVTTGSLTGAWSGTTTTFASALTGSVHTELANVIIAAPSIVTTAVGTATATTVATVSVVQHHMAALTIDVTGRVTANGTSGGGSQMTVDTDFFRAEVPVTLVNGSGTVAAVGTGAPYIVTAGAGSTSNMAACTLSFSLSGSTASIKVNPTGIGSPSDIGQIDWQAVVRVDTN